MTNESKIRQSAHDALGDVADGTSVVVGGFGDRGIPFALLDALAEREPRGLTVISINAGSGRTGVARLISERRVEKLICAFPRTGGSVAFEEAWQEGRIDLELVPMGSLVARLQAGAAGISAFYSAVGAGTALTEGREHRRFGDQDHVLELALKPDLALVRADLADPFGNLRFRGTDRNLNPVAARAAARTVAEVDQLADVIEPDRVETPGLYVAGLVAAPEREAS